MTDTSLPQALKEVEKQTKMSIAYNSTQLVNKQHVTLNLKEVSLDVALNTILKGTGFSYKIQDNYIMIVENKTKRQSSKTIKGRILDADGGSIVGVTIYVEKTTKGTTTNANGDYTLPNVTIGDVVNISYIGYTTQRFVVAEKDIYNITLQQNSEMLDDVVVTALGIKREQKTLSYNVQQVKGDELTTVKDVNFMNSLIGKVAGVQINSSASGAGGSTRVVMRGVKSMTSSNLALYVIDGVPMYNMANGGGDESIYSEQAGTDGVADLNPEDIESISMLTGPSAAALYGNSAAAGVVLITTKKGLVDETRVNVSNNTTFSTVAMMPEMQSKYGNLPNQLGSWGNVINNSYDPVDFFQTGVNVINTVSMATGNKRNQTYISASTTNTTSILPNSTYNRYNFSARNTTTFFDEKMTLDFGGSYIMQDDRNMMSQGYYYNPLPGLYLFPRSENFNDVRMYERYNSALDAMEQYWPYGSVTEGLQNPYWVQNREVRENKKIRYMMNASLKYEITDWLNIAGRVKVDNYENTNTYKMYASTDRLFSGVNGNYRNLQSTMRSTYADVIATVSKTFDDWSVNINVGTSVNDNQYEMIGYDGGLGIPNFFAVHNIAFKDGWKPNQEGWRDQSQAVFGNFEFGWRHMLYLTITGRNDWESKLAFSNYKSFFYPSVGLSAIVSNMINTPEWVSLLKVRASYTEVGNSYGRFMTTIRYPFNPQNHSWSTTAIYPNIKLKPERTKSWEVGVDARLFNNVSVNLTYYRSNTYNQTFHAELAPASGYTTMPIQSGNVMNQGVEMSLGYNKKWRDFSLSTSYTLTWNENKIEQLADGVINFMTGESMDMKELPVVTYGKLDARLILRPGGSMGDVYGQSVLARDMNGYILNDPNTGLHLTKEENYLGSIFPKANMGWSANFGYKGLNLGMTFTARIGGIVLSETQSNIDRYGVSKTTADIRDQGGIPINQGVVSAQEYYQAVGGSAYYYAYSATNVRLGELSLSYTLPKKWFGGSRSMTVGFVGKNLWMIYCKAPFDPELTSASASNYYQGFDSYMLPSTRNIGFSVKFQF